VARVPADLAQGREHQGRHGLGGNCHHIGVPGERGSDCVLVERANENDDGPVQSGHAQQELGPAQSSPAPILLHG
jgi:hypothetical protein